MDSTNRIINKVFIDFNISSRHATAVKSWDMDSILSEVFDEVLGDAQMDLYLDRLEIDCDMQIASPDALRAMLVGKLRDHLTKINHGIAKSPVEQPVDDPFAWFLEFLRTGRNPWYHSARIELPLEELVKPERLATLKQILSTEPIALKRLLLQFEESALEILKTFDTRALKMYLFFEKEIEHMLNRFQSQLPWGILRELKADARLEIGSRIITGTLHPIAKERSRLSHGMVKSLKQSNVPSHIIEAISAEFAKRYPDISTDNTVQLPSRGDTLKPPREINPKPVENITLSDSGLLLDYAGLVLLHPFIPRLFNNLGLLDGSDFRNERTQRRGTSLLFFLATGKTEFDEHLMGFCKYLCGCPLNAPLDRHFPLSEYETSEAEALLKSVIEHWSALKNTSIDGLRANFLRRQGLLKKDDVGHSVYIEKATIDILLERLPWTVSFFKLPWLRDITTIKWI